MVKSTLGKVVDSIPTINKLVAISEIKGEFPFEISAKLQDFVTGSDHILKGYNNNLQKFAQRFGDAIEKDVYDKGNDNHIYINGKYYEFFDKKKYLKYVDKLRALECDIFNFFPFTAEEFRGVKGLAPIDIQRLKNSGFLIGLAEEKKPEKVEEFEIEFDEEDEKLEHKIEAQEKEYSQKGK